MTSTEHTHTHTHTHTPTPTPQPRPLHGAHHLIDPDEDSRQFRRAQTADDEPCVCHTPFTCQADVHDYITHHHLGFNAVGDFVSLDDDVEVTDG